MIFANLACAPRAIYLDKNFNPPVYFGTHVVRTGDTLYSIAWRYGRDSKELAEANGINPPYVLNPGQKISLERRAPRRTDVPRIADPSPKKEPNVTTGKSSNKPQKNVTQIKKHKEFKDIKWHWPHLGPILATYKNGASSNGRGGINKGIDIAGHLGDPIFAAAAGEVVYAGSGLLGYGNLIIINHDEHYLSAYAHNRRILVQEGQQIKIKDKIAELGSSGVDRPMLHFEIRKDGQPVDPMDYLPKR